MNFDRFNQLEIEENDIVLDEQYKCPTCDKEFYSSIYMEKFSSNNFVGNTITINSKYDRIFYCKCSCGNSWLENYSPKHHRPHIRYIFMRNF